jgi:hypothetical protein
MRKKQLSIQEAAEAVLTLINFFQVLGFSPNAEKELGRFVNELFRGYEFTFQVESTLDHLDDLLGWILEMMELNASIVVEDLQSMLQQLQSTRAEKIARGRLISKKTKRGATHHKCSVCGGRKCGWDGRPTHAHAHPAKAHKAHK